MAQHYFFPRQFVKRHAWAHRLGQRIEAAAIGLLIGLLRVLPFGVSIAAARAVFRLIGPLTSTRLKVERNLRVAFPDQSPADRKRVVRAIFGNMGAAVAEIAQLDTISNDADERLEFVGEGPYAFEKGAPAVFVTAHVSAWTLTNFIPHHYHIPVTTVYAPESNPYIHDMIRYLREALPSRLIQRDSAMRGLMKELSAGRAVGLGSDVRLDTGEMVPFFGHDMLTNTVPARLALRYGCELIPVRAERLPDYRFRVIVGAPITPRDPSADVEAQIIDMSTQVNAAFEEWIRADPTQWMCLARRWPKEIERRGEL